MYAIRVLEALSLGGMVLCLVVLARRLQGNSLAGWCAGAIAALSQMMLDFWHTAQPETFGGILTVAALVIIVPAEQRRTGSFSAFLSGALLGAAGLMKPQLAGGFIVFAAYLLRQSSEGASIDRLRPLLALVGGCLTPLVACAVYFVTHGAWSDFWWTMHDFVPGYTALGWHSESSPLSMFHYALVESLTKFSAYIPIGIAAVWLLPSAHSREQEGVFLILGLIVLHAVGIAMQAKFFQYHYGATIPLLALLAAMGWAKLWWSAVPRGSLFVALFSIAAVFAGLISPGASDLPGTAWQRARWRWSLIAHRFNKSASEPLVDAFAKVAGFDLDADRDVAKWMAGQTGPDDTVLVWGFEPSVYWFAERTPATRFIYNVAQRTAWQQQKARRWFMNDVRKNKPVVVAVQHADIFPGVTGRTGDSAAELADFPEFAEWLRSNYFPAGYRFNFEYFRRHDSNP